MVNLTPPQIPIEIREAPSSALESISAFWEGTAFDAGSASRLKKIKRVFLEDAPDSALPASLKLSSNYGDFEELEMRGRQGAIRVYYVPTDLRRFRYTVTRIEHNEASFFELRGMLFQHKPKRKPKVRRGNNDYSPYGG